MVLIQPLHHYLSIAQQIGNRYSNIGFKCHFYETFSPPAALDMFAWASRMHQSPTFCFITLPLPVHTLEWVELYTG